MGLSGVFLVVLLRGFFLVGFVVVGFRVEFYVVEYSVFERFLVVFLVAFSRFLEFLRVFVFFGGGVKNRVGMLIFSTLGL